MILSELLAELGSDYTVMLGRCAGCGCIKVGLSHGPDLLLWEAPDPGPVSDERIVEAVRELRGKLAARETGFVRTGTEEGSGLPIFEKRMDG